jgi:hypothetical protein
MIYYTLSQQFSLSPIITNTVKQIRYQFWCTRCTLLKSRQWYLGRKKVGSPKIVGKSWKYQILCHEIEPNASKDRSMHEGDNPSFLNELRNLLRDSKYRRFISTFISYPSTKAYIFHIFLPTTPPQSIKSNTLKFRIG